MAPSREALCERPFASAPAAMLAVHRAGRDAGEQKQAQEQLQARARQQAAVAELGRRALTGVDSLPLMGEAVTLVRSNLGVEYANVLELLPDGRVLFQAGAGWEEGLVA